MSRRRVVVLASVLAASLGGDARAQQAPVTPPSTEPPAAAAPAGFTGSVTMGVSVESGQTDLTGVQLSFDGRRPYSDNGALTMSASYQHGTTRLPDTTARTTVADHMDAHLGVEHDYGERWVLMARTEALRDRIQRIDYRFTQILGVGPQLRKGRLHFRIVPGVQLLGHDKNVAGENGFNFNYGFFQDATVAINAGWSLSESLFASRDVSDSGDYFLSFSTSLTGAITRRLGIQFAYVHTYESLLPVGVDPRYQKTLVGLQVNF
ncbi:MAG: DUF481 domain-containing protein [Acidimicrobiia bacterium]|nr:DUF481 domain-containing protein [Acidimicrobiia bacterium]